MSLYTPKNKEEEIKNIIEVITIDNNIIYIKPSQIQFLIKNKKTFGVIFYDNNLELNLVTEETFFKLKKIMGE